MLSISSLIHTQCKKLALAQKEPTPGLVNYGVDRLEVQFQGELQDTRIIGLRDLAERLSRRVVDVLIQLSGSDKEVRLVEDVERLHTELNINCLRNRRTLDEPHIEIPQAGTADRSQLQTTHRPRPRV